MKLSRSVVLFIKGCFMGAADVIPGVSGGTIALIVGIYRELIHSLKQLNLRWVSSLWNYLSGRNPNQALQGLREHLQEMNVGFLVPLGLGILAAIAGGSTFIPALLANYPVPVKALFFGLILASVWIPFRIVDSLSMSDFLPALLVGIICVLLGFSVSNPNFRMVGSMQWVQLESEGTSFKALLEAVPSAKPAHRVYWSSENRLFRRDLKRRKPELSRELRTYRNRRISGQSPKETLKARSERYESMRVPEGLSVNIPRLSYWYIFLIGSLAITAMILPGISGSYILLILGSYFFVLNSVHGFLGGLVVGSVPFRHSLILLLFAAGAGAGLLVFTRLLDHLLNHWQTLTAAGLSGLMLGCLRGVWPFQRSVDGSVQLILPDALTTQVQLGLITFVIGMVLVLLLTLLSSPQTPPSQESRLQSEVEG